MTPRPPLRSAGRYSRKSTEESHISSSRSSLEPPAPSGAVIAASCDFSPKSEGDTRRETVGSTSNRAHEARCSRTGSRPGVPGRGYCRPNLPTPSPADLHRRLFDPSLEYSIDQVVLFCQPPYYFSQWSPSPFVVDGVSCAEQYVMAEKARILEDHRAVKLIMASPDPSEHKHRSRRALL